MGKNLRTHSQHNPLNIQFPAKDKNSMNTTSTSITRRQALKSVTIAALGAGLAGRLAAQDANAAKPDAAASTPRMPDSPWAAVRGFNYQPSYGSTGFELWQKFDPKTIETELARGKRFFPKMNALRVWLSWDSFKYDPKRFAANFEAMLALHHKHDLKVMPVLFNRWHDSLIDYGGIYIDHFQPLAGWGDNTKKFEAYLEAIVGGHKDDPRIMCWDLCNEPFSYKLPPDSEIVKAEFAWLKSLYGYCKKIGAMAPITVGIHPNHGRKGIEEIEPISDFLSIHPYWIPPANNADDAKSRSRFERLLDDYVSFGVKVGKPLLANETCWGSLDDAQRVEIVRYTLTHLKQRNIGWMAYLLHHSLIADAHRAEFAPVGYAGNLAFIEADGSLRPGHEAFNEF